MNRLGPTFGQAWSLASTRSARGAYAIAAAGLLTACSALFAPSPPAPNFYTLDAPTSSVDTSHGPLAPSLATSAPVMIVELSHAEAGFDTDRIVYVLEEHRLQPYADSQWIDTPSKMLAPLISAALSCTGVFSAVVQAPSHASGGWELQSDIVRFQQEVASARFRFTLNVTLIEKQTRTVILTREFDASAPIAGSGPAAAVAAANAVVADVLQQVGTASAKEVARRR